MYPALQRLLEATGCRTQSELAEFLGIHQASVSDAKKRGSIPAEWLLTALRKKGVNPDWVIHGEEPRCLWERRVVRVSLPDEAILDRMSIEQLHLALARKTGEKLREAGKVPSYQGSCHS